MYHYSALYVAPDAHARSVNREGSRAINIGDAAGDSLVTLLLPSDPSAALAVVALLRAALDEVADAARLDQAVAA